MSSFHERRQRLADTRIGDFFTEPIGALRGGEQAATEQERHDHAQ